jgi:hypothetical protein
MHAVIPALLALTLASPAEVPPVSPARRTLAGAGAVVPGLVVHGAGHFIRGETQTGWRLLAAEGIGLGAAVGGIAGLAVTGASPRTIAPLTWMLVHGVGLFGVSAFADLYGSVNGGRGAGAPVVRAPELTLDLGYRAIRDPVFAYTGLTVAGARGRHRALVLDGRAWFAVDHDNQRVRVTPRWRIIGPRPDREAADGGYLDLRTGAVWHRYGAEGFQSAFGELALRGRLDLHRIGPTLRGAFVEAEIGAAMGGTKHVGFDLEAESMLLGGFAFGLYLGHARDGYGEVSVYYDQRHDGYVAGSKARGLGSGSPGHYGLKSRVRVWGPWGLDLHAAAGSSWLGGGSVVYQWGGQR